MNNIESKKIGILTHYHNSLNYGGVLQAYALCHYLNEQGFSAEQIDYNYIDEISKRTKKTVKLFVAKILKKSGLFTIFSLKRRIEKTEAQKLKVRIKKFICFREQILHSEKVYNNKKIKKMDRKYECFIVGSDQIWNPDWYCEAFFLSFVDKRKKKIAYAASIGKGSLTNAQEELFRNKLSSFDAISVREYSAYEILKGCVKQEVQVVLDPTLLVEKEFWDTVAVERLIDEPYVFCYFLSKDIEIRNLAKEYSNHKQLKLVVLMHADGFSRSDISIGDISFYEAGPMDFVSLIKYAEYVFTDSYHASIFSCIYRSQFFVFNRKDKPGMIERINGLNSLFHFDDHIIDIKDKVENLIVKENIDFENTDNELLELRSKSRLFLDNALR